MHHCIYKFSHQHSYNLITSQIHIYNIACSVDAIGSQLGAAVVGFFHAFTDMVDQATHKLATQNCIFVIHKHSGALVNEQSHDARPQIAYLLVRVIHALHHV